MKKLFIVLRADLPPGAMLAQTGHAVRAFVAAEPELDRAWFHGPNNLVVLATPNETTLGALLDRARAAGVPLAECREPDLGDSLTAIALADVGARLVSSLPLALRAPRAA